MNQVGMGISRQLLIGAISLGLGVLFFIPMTLLAAMLPNSKPPAWVNGVFQLTVVLGFIGTLSGIGFLMLALVRWAIGGFR